MNILFDDCNDDRLCAELISWMQSTLTHARCDYIRQQSRKKKTVSLDSIPPDTIADPRDYFTAVEHSATDFEFEEARLAYAFSKLPLMRREVLRLLFVEQKEPEEISEILHCSTNYVYLQKSRALKRLRELLTEREDTNG